MKFLMDSGSEIRSTAYSVDAGKVSVKIQYKSRPRGFFVCVLGVFSEKFDESDELLLRELVKCSEKSGSSFTYKSKEDVEYQFFYISEEKLKSQESKVVLPSTVKSPAKIYIYWLDEERNVHVENEDVSEIIIPILISVEKKEYKKGVIKKEYFYELTFSSNSMNDIKDAIVYYRINGKSAEYPIPKHLFAQGKKLVIKKTSETTRLDIGIFNEYKKTYKLQIKNI